MRFPWVKRPLRSGFQILTRDSPALRGPGDQDEDGVRTCALFVRNDCMFATREKITRSENSLLKVSLAFEFRLADFLCQLMTCRVNWGMYKILSAVLFTVV